MRHPPEPGSRARSRRALAVALGLAAIALTDAATAAQASVPLAEVQLSLCGEVDHIIRALALVPRSAPTTVWLFDDDALTLFERGVRLRLRITGKRSELTLKVADQDCARLDPALVPAADGKCEYDVHGSEMKGAVSLTRRLDARTRADLVARRIPPADALGPAQVRFLREVARLWPLPAGVRPLGPIALSSYRTQSGGYDVDVSRMPAGERYVEISRKQPVKDAPALGRAMADDVGRAGVEICPDQSAQAVNKLRSLRTTP
jgi:hypothetical protein